MSLPSWPRDIQITVSACCSISGNVSSLMAATTISIPWLRAASSTRKGNLPFPAMSPYLLDDTTIRFLNEIQNDLNLRRTHLGLDGFDCLARVQICLQQQTKRFFDVLDLLRHEAFLLEADDVRTIGFRF